MKWKEIRKKIDNEVPDDMNVDYIMWTRNQKIKIMKGNDWAQIMGE